MSAVKKIKRFAKSVALAPRVIARYGHLRPDRVRLTGCDHWVHIDPTDQRAVKKFIHDPVRGRVSPPLAFWRAFNAHLQPAVALDVGLNYGECLFGARYAPNTHIFGFEANPRLIPLLEKSRTEHPDGSRMTITHGLVSDQPQEGIPFYVNPAWSGTASADPNLNRGANALCFKIASVTLDQVIPKDLVQNQRLLFKMDIEGYESRAFGGFSQSLDAAALVVGFIEFDSSMIQAAGESPEAYFQRLAGRFDLYRLDESRKQSIVRVGDLQSLPRSRSADGRLHTDLILVSPGSPSSTWLPAGWHLR